MLYGPLLPFTITELYTPDGARGVYTKRAQMPGGRLIELPTVVVDATPSTYILYSCLAPLGVAAVSELVVATRSSAVNESMVQRSLAVAKGLGVPFDAAKVTRVSHEKGCR